MTRPRLLDLYCGAGGAAKGYHDAGFDVTGIDIARQPNYPYESIVADALWWLRNMHGIPPFDAIHASPPCQAHSALTRGTNQGREYPDLVAATRSLLEETGLPYVIENVVGAPLNNPATLCGSMFGLDVRRHRLFETSFPLLVPSCSHGYQHEKKYDLMEHGRWFKSATVSVFGTGGGKAAEHWPEAMGIDWMTRSELAQAIPPAYTQYIGLELLRQLAAAA